MKDSKDDALDIANEAYEEHLAADMLLAEIKKIDVSDEVWLGKFMVIKENLEHHIKRKKTTFSKSEEIFWTLPNAVKFSIST